MITEYCFIFEENMRKDLKKYCDKIIDNCETIIITRKNDKNVVLMSLIV